MRRLLPQADIVLIDRHANFVSFSGSNAWLLANDDSQPFSCDFADLAARHGYRFVQGAVQEIDRVRQVVRLEQAEMSYDFLVLGPGIREHFAAWGIVDREMETLFRQRAWASMGDAHLLPHLRQRLARFGGGNLVMNIPPLPYRCPPAPYERAVMLAGWIKARHLSARLIVIDPNPLMPLYRRPLLETFRDQVSYLDHAQVRQVDLMRNTVSTDVDEIAFDAALLSPPQQAAQLLWDAGLIRVDPQSGQADAWGDVGGLDLRSRRDEHIWIIGDAVGMVSSLFGQYPKTGHLAASMGRIAAAQLASAIAGRSPGMHLPESVCHIQQENPDAPGVRIQTHYRQRSDGFLMQEVIQSRTENYQQAAADWFAGLKADFL
ncbi:MAG: NAD(P)/FAD-dependent oxidoreductase [Azonexus sp.]|nr:NAD(P)/FAD-dependent oxidoreductase [Azonexus sp.]